MKHTITDVSIAGNAGSVGRVAWVDLLHQIGSVERVEFVQSKWSNGVIRISRDVVVADMSANTTSRVPACFGDFADMSAKLRLGLGARSRLHVLRSGKI